MPKDHFARLVISNVMMDKEPQIRRNWLVALKQSIYNQRKLNIVSTIFFCKSHPNARVKFSIFFIAERKGVIFLCSQKVLNQREIDRLHQLAINTEVDVIYPHIKDGLTPLMMLTSYNNSDTFRQCFDALLQRDEINVCVQEEKGINALHRLFL